MSNSQIWKGHIKKVVTNLEDTYKLNYLYVLSKKVTTFQKSNFGA